MLTRQPFMCGVRRLFYPSVSPNLFYPGSILANEFTTSAGMVVTKVQASALATRGHTYTLAQRLRWHMHTHLPFTQRAIRSGGIDSCSVMPERRRWSM